MDPYDEARLRNEVLYLHHLWHQGPPNSTPPNPNPSPTPYIPHPGPSFHHSSPWLHQYIVNPRPPYPFIPNPIHPHPRPLQPRNSTTFKKKKAGKRKGSKRRTQPDPSLNSGSEWPTPMPAEDSAPMVSGWPPLEPRSTAAIRPLSAEEKERLGALQVQYKARQACRAFLFDSDGDDDDDDVDNDVEDDEDDVDDDGSEEIGDFFVKLFAENNELKKYYEKCCEGGEFRCLVCGVVGNKNAGKKFHDCVGLVQHAMTLSRTRTRRAHRAFGHAVCRVLGWDVNRLPTIVIKKEVKPAEAEGEPKEDAGDGKNSSESSDKSDDRLSAEHPGEPVKQDAKVVHETINQVSESFSKKDNLNKNAENLDEKISDARSDKEEGTDQVSLESPVSDVEWVCKSPNHAVSSAASGWRAFNTQSSSHMQYLSAEEQANLAVLQLQHKALEACHEFLVGNVSSDCDEDDGDDEDEDEYDSEECEEFKFFLRVFTEDKELRRYYENNYREGDFYCLVCGGIGKKVWKRFKDCFALLQHSTAILRTKRKRAHRAYAQAICKVLGWDFDRLPAIVSKGEPLGSSLDEPEKSAEDQIGHSVVCQENNGKVISTCDMNSGEDHDVHHKNSDL